MSEIICYNIFHSNDNVCIFLLQKKSFFFYVYNFAGEITKEQNGKKKKKAKILIPACLIHVNLQENNFGKKKFQWSDFLINKYLWNWISKL